MYGVSILVIAEKIFGFENLVHKLTFIRYFLSNELQITQDTETEINGSVLYCKYKKDKKINKLT
jgi:hypothetical protein